eukprot:gene6145-11535_t
MASGSCQDDDETVIDIFISKNLWKDYNATLEISKQGKLVENPDQVKEITHLLEYCGDKHCFDANITSFKLLLKLVVKSIIPKDYLLKKILILSATKKILQHLISSIKPFITFVLLDPDRTSRFRDARTLFTCFAEIIKTLYDSGHKEEAINIAEFLFLIVQFRKTADDFIYDNTILTEQLALCLLGFQSDENVSFLLKKIGYHAMSLCHKLVDVKRNLIVHLSLLEKIFLNYPKGFLSDEFLYLLALLLYKSPAIYHEKILRLGLHVIPCCVALRHPSQSLSVLKAFVLPLFTIIADQNEEKDRSTCQKIAHNLFMNIRCCYLSSKNSDDEGDDNRFLESECLADELMIAKHHCRLLIEINRSEPSAKEFIHAFNESKTHSDSLILMLSTLVVNPQNENILSDVLATITTFGMTNPKMAINFLPLLLHTSNQCGQSSMKFMILESLPLLGTNKLLVSPVLKAILMLSTSNAVLPLAIRLTKDLWKIQPRIFPYLQQLLSKRVELKDMSQAIWEELNISRVSTLLEICKLRPTQHGPDVIGLLASIFNDFEKGQVCARSEVADSIVYLALEALKFLCEAEVSDFQTAWAEVSPKVLSSQSPIVIKGIISFVSLAPRVLGRSTADLNFIQYACDFIWQYVDHENPNVGSAAFAFLTNFQVDSFTVGNLPPKVRPVIADLLLRKHNMKKRPEDDDFNPYREQITGPAYALLLRNMADKTTEGYGTLLTKLLTKEVEMLPRNISSATAARRLGSTYEKFVEGIPWFLQSMYRKTCKSALIPGLASGLLSCFKTTIHLGKREEPGRNDLIEDAKINRQMLDNLLGEVNVEPADWQHAIMAPISWAKLMDRIFDVTLEGRKAELSLQFDKGSITEEYLKSETESSFCWVRDQLTSQLMKASKGIPTMQGNSVLALAALAVKVSTSSDNKGDDDLRNQSVQYLDKKSWLAKVADTIMVVLDGNFKPKTTPLQWCQQFSSHKSTASSLLSRAAAAIAVSEVASSLISVDLERIQQITQFLITRITGQEKAGKSSIIQFSSAIGLGILLNRLQQQGFNDVIGQEGYFLCARALHVLERTVYDTELCNREGAVFGYGLALCATFTESSKDSRVYAIAAYNKLAEFVKNLDLHEKPSLLDEGFYFALAVSTVSGFSADLIKASVVAEALDVINSVRKMHPASYVLQAAYGMLLQGSLYSGLSQTKSLVEIAVDLWLQDMTDQKKATEERTACVYGLLNTFGCSSFLFQFDQLDVFDASLKNKLAVVVKTLQQLVEITEESSFCIHCCRLLGLLHLVYLGGTQRQSALPGNYNYLTESSLLRSLFDCLVEAGKSGPNGRFSSQAVNSIIHPLISTSAMKLPPVNWALVLSPLMKLGFDKETRRLCFKFAVLNISSSATIPTWLLSWMNPSVFLSLEIECKQEILSSINHIIKFIPINKVKMVAKDMMLKAFLEPDATESQKLAVLASMKKMAEFPNPVQSCLLCVKCALQRITANEDAMKDHENIKGIADCVLRLPNELQHDFLNNIQTTEHIIRIESAMVAYFGSRLKTMERAFELFLGGKGPVYTITDKEIYVDPECSSWNYFGRVILK